MNDFHRRVEMMRTYGANNPMKSVGCFPDDVQHWAVLRTSARWEKKIVGALLDAGVPAYLPTLTRVVQYASKRQMTEIPLFSGYVFCSEPAFLGNPRVSQACRKLITQVLRPGDPGQLKRELQHIAEVSSNHQMIQERIYGSPGEKVRIVSGPLSGTRGIVRSLKPKKRILVLEVSFLGVRVEVEVEEHQVEKE
jgi:transcription antitermination factor NusG